MAVAAAFAVAVVAQVAIGYLFPSEGPRLKDLKVSASTYGAVIPEGYGTVRVAGNLIWCSKIREKKTKKSGKGGGYYNEYTYFVDLAMAFCRGPISQIRRVWADGKLIYDVTGTSKVTSSSKYRFRWYLGGEDQLPDPLMIAQDGEENTPAYRGLAYMIGENFPLKDFGNRIPQFAAEIYVDVAGDSGASQMGTGALIDYIDPVESTDLSSTGSEFVADYARGFFYAAGGANSGSARGLRRFRFTDAHEDRQVLSSAMALPVYDSVYASPTPQIQYVLGVASDGGVIIHTGGLNNYAPIVRLDPISYQATAYWPPISQGGGFWPAFGNDSSPSNATGACATNGLYYGHIGRVADGCGVFYTPTMELVGFANLENPRCIVGNEDNAGTFYVLTEDAGDNISIHLANVDGVTALETLTPADFGFTGTPVEFQPIGMLYDAADAGIIAVARIDSANYMLKWSADTEQVTWAIPLPAGVGGRFGPSRVLNGEIAFTDGSVYYGLNTTTGLYIDRDADYYAVKYVEDQTDQNLNDADQGVPIDIGTVSSNQQSYDSVRRTLICKGISPAQDAVLGLGAGLMQGTSLGGIVETLLRNGGLASKNMDLGPLYDVEVRGYGWANPTDIKSVIDELRQVYLFDLVESNGQITAVIRGETSSELAVTIPQNVLGSSNDNSLDFWKETRLSEADLPERMTLVVMNADHDFETTAQTAKRISNPAPTMFSRQRVTVEANLVMTPTEAKNQVHKMLYAQWKERTKHETRLPWAYMNLDPSDLLRIELNDGRDYLERLHQTELGADFAIQIETYGQDSGAYTADKIGEGGGSGRPQEVPGEVLAEPFVLNTPLLRDTDSTGGAYSRYYTAVGSSSPETFRGATLFKSINNLDFDVLYAEPEALEWGVVDGVVPPPSHGAFALDWETEITIFPAVSWFDLESITDDEMTAGLNACMVGDEVIQFRDAVENADGSWTIRNLARGRRGTEYACDTHKVGDKFIFLNNSTVEPQGEVVDARGQARYFKAIGSGMSLNAAQALTVIYEPRDLMPYAVSDIQREFVSDGIDLSWSRRTRLGGNMVDGTGEVSLNEAYERYAIYILGSAFDGDLSRGNEPITFTRMMTSDTPAFTYTHSQQEADGFDANLDTLHVVIYQLSDAVGRGFPSPRSIEPWRDS